MIVNASFVLLTVMVVTSTAFNPLTANAFDQLSTSKVTHDNFNFAAAGDWGCKEATQRTVNNIKNINPRIVLGLGDFSYENDTGCWFKIMSPLLNKTKIVIGEHDFDTNNSSRLYDYVNKFNLTNPYYSFSYGNVHFLAMSSVIPFSNQSLQYKLLRDESQQKQFMSNDLYYASQNKSINWIVVYVYEPMYTSPTLHPSNKVMRDMYHPLFDQYGVDLVLQAHNHNYQRSLPIRFNYTNSSNPIITDRNISIYHDPIGAIFMVVGTGGAHQYDLLGKSPYIVTQFQRFGFLKIDIVQNGTKMVGTFLDSRDGKSKDQFTIIKGDSAQH